MLFLQEVFRLHTKRFGLRRRIRRRTSEVPYRRRHHGRWSRDRPDKVYIF